MLKVFRLILNKKTPSVSNDLLDGILVFITGYAIDPDRPLRATGTTKSNS